MSCGPIYEPKYSAKIRAALSVPSGTCSLTPSPQCRFICYIIIWKHHKPLKFPQKTFLFRLMWDSKFSNIHIVPSGTIEENTAVKGSLTIVYRHGIHFYKRLVHSYKIYPKLLR